MDKELLKRFFEGRATTDEEMRVREWMDASEENRRAYFRERKMYDMTLLLTDEAEIKSAPQPTKKNVRFFIKFTEIAAVAVITLVVTLFYKNREEQNYWLTAQKISAPAGQRVQLELSDGTQVWLNARTKIEYPAAFVGKDRRVKLDGEAYFQVAKNASKPFIVQTSKGDVEVLGTKFNVESYSDDNTFTTALMEGAVKVTAGGYQCNLKPNQMAYLKDGKIRVAPIEDYNPYRWREGIISFKNETFPDIIHKFEKYYGVEFRIENKAVISYRCSGKFRHSDGVQYALRVLQKDVDFKFTRDEENHIIYIK